MLHQSTIHQSTGLGALAPDNLEIAVVLFTREQGRNASRQPFWLRMTFSLNDMLADWHSYLRTLAFTHPAWVERDPEDYLQFDDSLTRGIWVGEVQGREHEPPVKPIGRDLTGTIRQLLYYAFPRESIEPSTGARKATRSRQANLRSLALIIPVVYRPPHDMDVGPPQRIKKVCFFSIEYNVC